MDGNADYRFLSQLLIQICEYAVKNGMEPDDTIIRIADNMKAMVEIMTFNGWGIGDATRPDQEDKR